MMLLAKYISKTQIERFPDWIQEGEVIYTNEVAQQKAYATGEWRILVEDRKPSYNPETHYLEEQFEIDEETDNINGTFVIKKKYQFNDTLPSQISIFELVKDETNKLVICSWFNPVNPYFGGVKVVRKQGSRPQNPDDGFLVYDGMNESVVDDASQFESDVFYYYRIFAKNSEGQVQSVVGSTIKSVVFYSDPQYAGDFTVNWYFKPPSFGSDIRVDIPHTTLTSNEDVSYKHSKSFVNRSEATLTGYSRYYIAESTFVNTSTKTDTDGNLYYANIPTNFNVPEVAYYIEQTTGGVFNGTYKKYKLIDGSFLLDNDRLYNLEDITENLYIGPKLPPVKYGKSDTLYFIQSNNEFTLLPYYNLYMFDSTLNKFSDALVSGIYDSEIWKFKLSKDSNNAVTLTPIFDTVSIYTTDNYTEYAVFVGWDKSTGHIVANDFDSPNMVNVYAKWDVVRLSRDNDGKYNLDKELNECSPSEFFAMCDNSSNMLVDKDYLDIYLGSDFTYENVEEITLVTPDNPLVMNYDAEGGDYVEIQSSPGLIGGFYNHPIIPVDNNNNIIRLFDPQHSSFTLAIDFQFIQNKDSIILNNSSLLSCYESENNNGVTLNFESDNAVIHYGSSNIVTTSDRINLIIRHSKGDDSVYIYYSGTNGERVNVIEKQGNYNSTDYPLVLGGLVEMISEQQYRAVSGKSSSGVINWCKVWFDDLGSHTCKQLASWIRERCKFEYFDNNASDYTYFNQNGNRVKASFVCSNSLKYPHVHQGAGNNSGGWIGRDSNNTFIPNELRVYMNNRLYEGTPTWLQSLLSCTRVPSNTGLHSTTAPWTNGTYTGNSYWYAPAYTEMNGSSSVPYILEGRKINWLSTATTDAYRLKFMNIIPNIDTVTSAGTAKFTTSSEPIVAGGKGLYDPDTNPNGVKEFDIWQARLSTAYIFLTQETLIKKRLTPAIPVSISRNAIGGWIAHEAFWLRSPITGSSASFGIVGSTGSTGSTESFNARGVSPCFSI